jgi:hypothetical protein
MTAGEDVTSIRWEPVPKEEGTGEVTIEHALRDPLTASMDLAAARRLVDRLLGSDRIEISIAGDCVRWDRRSLAATSWG